jgi:hypothetical protein
MTYEYLGHKNTCYVTDTNNDNTTSLHTRKYVVTRNKYFGGEATYPARQLHRERDEAIEGVTEPSCDAKHTEAQAVKRNINLK